MSENQSNDPRHRARRVRRSLGFIVQSPVRPFSVADVRGGAGFVRTLFNLLRRRTAARDGICLSDDRIDVRATADLYDVSPQAVEVFLAQQQDAAYWRTIAGLALSVFVLIAWVYVALSWYWTCQLFITALEFLPFWSALALFVIHAAHQNWMYRERRACGLGHFITTADTLWPTRSAL